MATFRVLITSVFLHPADAVDQLLRDAGCETIYRPWDGTATENDLADLLRDVDAAIMAGDRITARVLDGARRLKVISRTGVGYDAIDVAAATERGIVVCNTPDVNRDAVADLTLLLILMCARRVHENLALVRHGRWERVEGRDLMGSTLGLVGLGSIGKAVVQRSAAFGLRLLAHDPRQDPEFAAAHGMTYVPLEALLRESDYVSLHLPLSPTTRHLMGAEQLALMKPSAYLINTARGPLVDERALYEALASGRLAGAGLDVFEREPLPHDSPLRSLPNVYLLPHVGGVTTDARERSGMKAADNVLRVLFGREPRHVLNPAALAPPWSAACRNDPGTYHAGWPASAAQQRSKR